ncbi:hypothetical protein QUF72_19775, partial [Desulfobacterales bacterium HSG2]|nr:hypothetical protein [Desulfobacterales bacterium HSG2]
DCQVRRRCPDGSRRIAKSGGGALTAPAGLPNPAAMVQIYQSEPSGIGAFPARLTHPAVMIRICQSEPSGIGASLSVRKIKKRRKL